MKTKRMPTFEEVSLGIKYTPLEPIAAFEVLEPLNQIDKYEASANFYLTFSATA